MEYKNDKIKQRNQVAFDLRAILQKRHTSWANNNKMMYETTDSQDLKLKKKNK